MTVMSASTPSDGVGVTPPVTTKVSVDGGSSSLDSVESTIHPYKGMDRSILLETGFLLVGAMFLLLRSMFHTGNVFGLFAATRSPSSLAVSDRHGLLVSRVSLIAFARWYRRSCLLPRAFPIPRYRLERGRSQPCPRRFTAQCRPRHRCSSSAPHR